MPPPGGEPDANPWAADAIPKIKYDPVTQDIILDMAAVVSIPFDPTNNGVQSLRAIIAPKGKVLRVPNQPGCLVVDGEWSTQQGLAVVHYKSATKRLPGLLLTFVDHGIADVMQHGVSISALRLPLLIRKNIYQDTVMIVPITDVVGFTPIAHTDLPWSLHLEPTLKKLVMFKTLKIFQPSHIGVYIGRKLSSRIEQLNEMALAELAIDTAAIERQDPSQASRLNASRIAKLNSLIDAIRERSNAYDIPLASRVLKLQAPHPSAWALSPIRVAFSKADKSPIRLLRSRLMQMPTPIEPNEAANILLTVNHPATSPIPECEPADSVSQREDRLADDPDSDLSSDSDSDSDKDVRDIPKLANISGAKRQRLAPLRFEASVGQKKKQKKPTEKDVAKKAAKRGPSDDASLAEKIEKLRAAGLNRYGQPFKRGPYNSRTGAAGNGLRTTLNPKLERAQTAEKSETTAKLTDMLTKVQTELSAANLKITSLSNENASLTSQLMNLRALTQLEIKAAVLESQVRSSNKMVQQFAAGVAMGQGMPQSSKQNMQLMTPYVSASAPSNSSLQQPHFGSTDTSE